MSLLCALIVSHDRCVTASDGQPNMRNQQQHYEYRSVLPAQLMHMRRPYAFPLLSSNAPSLSAYPYFVRQLLRTSSVAPPATLRVLLRARITSTSTNPFAREEVTSLYNMAATPSFWSLVNLLHWKTISTTHLYTRCLPDVIRSSSSHVVTTIAQRTLHSWLQCQCHQNSPGELQKVVYAMHSFPCGAGR